ncbi:MAG: hypothetical protein M0Q54_07080 [Pigmentiphaga sp.]|nr:hypothetical protein [Pigmentiphaga sp.]
MNKIDISGNWAVQLDSMNVGITEGWNNKIFSQPVQLPGTTDDAGLGVPNMLEPRLEKPQLLHLTRKNSYLGSAWYSKEITTPKDWAAKQIRLSLERVIWQTNVWIDGKEIPQMQNSLSTPHVYDLTGYIIPGKTQKITIRVDNRKKYDISIRNLAHAYTNDTQVIWNGIIGKMILQAFDSVSIGHIDIQPDISNHRAQVDVSITNVTDKSLDGYVEIQAKHKQSGERSALLTENIRIPAGVSVHSFDYVMDTPVKLWSEHHPDLYTLQVSVQTANTSSVDKADFGMRAFGREGSQLTINGKPLFLRGTLECNIFPLTGYPPMTKPGWEKVFKTAKSWGLNHLRFHSWCPPEAAFEVADAMGFYLQVELPVWSLNIGDNDSTVTFLYKEADRIMKAYGNHPSFCMWSMGNELQGDMSVLADLVQYLKQKDSRRLYTTTSFTFEKGYGVWPQPEDDYFITQWTNKGWVRGQGVFNAQPPNFDTDYAKSVEGAEVPIITHEIGQYAVYPNLDEIAKYTGVLLPLNFEAVKADLEQKGMLGKAAQFTKASGKLASVLYKEEIERALKTQGISGFQLLDLHDFPGQGTALVGLLDAFWDNKGVVSADEFRQACNDVVPLLRFPKAVYRADESFHATVDFSNYSDKELADQLIRWKLMDGATIIAAGEFATTIHYGYNADASEINLPLNFTDKASKLTVHVSLKDLPYHNQWNIWVYPPEQDVNFGKVKYTRDLEEARKLLDAGEIVLFNPDFKDIKGVEGRFVPVFWSPVHFPKQAATMGVLCNPNHAAFAQFPTDMHTDWQWWDIIKNSTTMITDSIQGGAPVVEIIDNFVTNRKLAMIYEGSVGPGKLMLVSCDLQTDINQRLVAKQLLISILDYMNSQAFNPGGINNFDVLRNMLKLPM